MATIAALKITMPLRAQAQIRVTQVLIQTNLKLMDPTVKSKLKFLCSINLDTEWKYYFKQNSNKKLIHFF